MAPVVTNVIFSRYSFSLPIFLHSASPFLISGISLFHPSSSSFTELFYEAQHFEFIFVYSKTWFAVLQKLTFLLQKPFRQCQFLSAVNLDYSSKTNIVDKTATSDELEV